MRKRHANLLLLVTAVFAAFTLGFFAGRNYNPTPVQISVLRSAEETNAPQPQLVLQASLPETEAPTQSTPPSTVPSEPVDTTPPVTSAPDQTEETAAVQEAPKQTEAVTETQAPAAETEAASRSSSGLININTASAAQLMTLPGIGEVLAQRIVEYREANGPFQSVAALTNVKGIGEKRLAAIMNLVTV